MFSSEKVLQMSYANYQYVSPLSYYGILPTCFTEAKKPSWRNSRTPASWMNVRLGGPRYSTLNRGPSRVPLNLSRRPRTFAGRSAAQ